MQVLQLIPIGLMSYDENVKLYVIPNPEYPFGALGKIIEVNEN